MKNQLQLLLVVVFSVGALNAEPIRVINTSSIPIFVTASIPLTQEESTNQSGCYNRCGHPDFQSATSLNCCMETHGGAAESSYNGWLIPPGKTAQEGFSAFSGYRFSVYLPKKWIEDHYPGQRQQYVAKDVAPGTTLKFPDDFTAVNADGFRL